MSRIRYSTEHFRQFTQIGRIEKFVESARQDSLRRLSEGRSPVVGRESLTSDLLNNLFKLFEGGKQPSPPPSQWDLLNLLVSKPGAGITKGRRYYPPHEHWLSGPVVLDIVSGRVKFGLLRFPLELWRSQLDVLAKVVESIAKDYDFLLLTCAVPEEEFLAHGGIAALAPFDTWDPGFANVAVAGPFVRDNL